MLFILVSIVTVAYVCVCDFAVYYALLFELQLISFLNDLLFKTFDYAILINYNNCYAKFSKEKKIYSVFCFYIQTRTFQRMNINTFVCFVPVVKCIKFIPTELTNEEGANETCHSFNAPPFHPCSSIFIETFPLLFLLKYLKTRKEKNVCMRNTNLTKTRKTKTIPLLSSIYKLHVPTNSITK